MRIILFFTVLMTIMTAAFLFRVKHEVLGIERRVIHLTSNIFSLQREMNILRNELAHLIQPARMVAVVGEGAPMSTLKRSQLVSSKKPSAAT